MDAWTKLEKDEIPGQLVGMRFGRILVYVKYYRFFYLCVKWTEEWKLHSLDNYSEFWSGHKDSWTSNFRCGFGIVQTYTNLCMGHKLAIEIIRLQQFYEVRSMYGLVNSRQKECQGQVQKCFKKQLQVDSDTKC